LKNYFPFQSIGFTFLVNGRKIFFSTFEGIKNILNADTTVTPHRFLKNLSPENSDFKKVTVFLAIIFFKKQYGVTVVSAMKLCP